MTDMQTHESGQGLPAVAVTLLPDRHPRPAGSSQQQDIELVQAVKKGDRSAFETLVEKYRHRVYHHCMRLIRDEEYSHDLTQEVLLRVYRNIDRYQHNYAFYTWVYRITANCCIDFLRRKKRQPADLAVTPMVGSHDFDENWQPELPDERFRPDDTVMQKELGEVIRCAIGRLPEKLGRVLMLRDVEGYSYDEIAQTLGCTGGTVKSRLFRARAQLRERLGPYLR